MLGFQALSRTSRQLPSLQVWLSKLTPWRLVPLEGRDLAPGRLPRPSTTIQRWPSGASDPRAALSVASSSCTRGLCARRWGRWCWGAEFGPLVREEFENENGEKSQSEIGKVCGNFGQLREWKGNLSYTKHQAYVSWFGLSPSYTKKEPPMTDRLSRNSPCSCPPQNSSGSCEASPWRTSTACSAHEQSQSSGRQRGIE